MKDDTARRRRLASLPAVHVLLGHPSLKALADETGHAGVTEAVRKTLADARAGLLRHPDAPSVDTETLVARVVGSLADGVTSLRPVVNASGILLHPAAPPPLAAEAVEAMRIAQTSAVYNVEPHIREHLRVLTDAEDTLIVHTPQAGLYLIADALGRGKEWVVSRAHLGAGPGAWSLPDVLGRCVGGLVEVGATNKTHLTDYRRAVGPATGAILVARPGVYALRGFVEEPALSDIACLGKETGVPVVFDAGHAPLTPDGPERRFASLAEAVRDGAALTVVRGDGLAGGPASGLIAGQRAWIEMLRNHPIYPMIKPSWPVLAGWEATLRVLRARGPAGHPAGFWFGDSADTLHARAERCVARLSVLLVASAIFSVLPHTAYPTVSRLPGEAFPSAAVAARPVSGDAHAVVAALFRRNTALLAVVEEGRVIFDFRGVDATGEEAIFQAVREMVG